MFILVLPVVVFADNEAEIKSIEFIEKSEGTVVVNEASTDGVKVNLDLIFHDVDDYASYKIILKNNTGTSLYINDDIFNSSKEYIKYNFIYEDGKNIIKSGEEKEVTLKVTYSQDVPKNLYRNAEYDASSDDPLILSDKFINLPNTLKNFGILGISVLIISSACILMGVYVVLKNNKKSTINTLLLLLLLLLIPKGASALLKYEIPIDSKILIKATKENPCTFEGNLVQGAQFVNGQYTYRYMQKRTYNSWSNVTLDGWGVALTDRTSTDAVTSKLCTSINDKPIVYMDYMFYESNSQSIDLSSFDTSNVVSMNYMFSSVNNVEELDLSSFDTRNVKIINNIFY
jgi:surface protein